MIHLLHRLLYRLLYRSSSRILNRLPDRWVLVALLISAFALLPMVTLSVLSVNDTRELWQHLLSTVFWTYLINTLLLCIGVALLTTLLGTSTAWLVTRFHFPLRSLYVWALLLPLAVPGYVLAFVITDQLEYAGPVQKALRHIFEWQTARDYWFPEIRSVGGATLVLSLVLYPYVYLLARSAFIEQTTQLYDISRTLGKNQWQSFFRVVLPLARPAIVVGVTLALMETLNEYGTVAYFAVPTLTTGLVDVWMNLGNLAGAAQIAIMLVSVALLLLLLERVSRSRGRFFQLTGQSPCVAAKPLPLKTGLLASAICLLPLALGFILPAVVLADYALDLIINSDGNSLQNYWRSTWTSLRLAAYAALFTTLLGVLLSYGVRLSKSVRVRWLAELSTVGYAIPGAVLAIGILWPMGLLDNWIDGLATDYFNVSTGLLVTGSMVALVLAYALRFIALSYRTLDAGLTKVTFDMDDASRALGKSHLYTLTRIHLPLLKPALLTSLLLIFVDTMKELPITLILRPFNVETLATQVWDQASQEQLAQSSLAALTIVLAGILPVIVMSISITKRPSHGN